MRSADHRRRGALLLGLFLCVPPAQAQEWTRFRGPNGSGLSDARLPAEWTDRDVRWKVPLPGTGHSSPVLWGDRVFLTAGDPKTGQRLVVCVGAANGKLLWRKDFEAPVYRTHKRNSVATSTPCVDADRLYVTWAAPAGYAVMALSHDGATLWQADLGTYDGVHGFGASPILCDDVLIVAGDQDKTGWLAGLGRADGKVRWKLPRQSGNETYATPCLLETPGRPKEVVFTNWKHGVTSVDPRRGKIHWELSAFEPAKKERSIASPVVADGLVVATCGFVTAQKHMVVVRPPAGTSEKPGEVWRLEKQVSYLPTPLVKGQRVYLCNEKGTASCLNLVTGRLVWQERLDGEFYASPVCAGDHIYCASTAGDVYTLAAGDEFRVLGRNALGEGTQATPAIANGCLYFRTERHLIAVGPGR